MWWCYAGMLVGAAQAATTAAGWDWIDDPKRRVMAAFLLALAGALAPAMAVWARVTKQANFDDSDGPAERKPD